jgi:hypothetical protein
MSQLSDGQRLALFSKRVKDLQDAQAMSHSSAMVLAGGAAEKARQLGKRVEELEKRTKRLEKLVASLEGANRQLFQMMMRIAKASQKDRSKP